jgi:hypothetical protein
MARPTPPDAAAELFLREFVGVPEEGLAGMKAGPAWEFLVEKAPSLPYDVLLCSPWDLLPDAELVEIPDEDHAVLQRPAALAPVLRRFFG